MGNEHQSNESSVKRKHPINVMIPPECTDPDGGECKHSKSEVKKEQNPV